MSVQIKGGKLLRLNYIIANQSDRLRLIAKLKQGYAEADAIKRLRCEVLPNRR
jgi:hypothetical protein